MNDMESATPGFADSLRLHLLGLPQRTEDEQRLFVWLESTPSDSPKRHRRLARMQTHLWHHLVATGQVSPEGAIDWVAVLASIDWKAILLILGPVFLKIIFGMLFATEEGEPNGP